MNFGPLKDTSFEFVDRLVAFNFFGAYEPCYESQQQYGNFSINLFEWNYFMYGIVFMWTMVSAFEQLGRL